MRNALICAAAVSAIFASSLEAQPECLQPKWTECVSFPNGGRHTGIDAYGAVVQSEIPTNSIICVSNEWEIMADTYVQFSRNGVPWPDKNWEVRVETFCLYRN
jgi:hypothetical protein